MPYNFTDRANGVIIDASHVNELQAALESSGPVLRVAASDATQREKDWSHYVCDGTADQTEVNAAIGALPTAGGAVQLSSGTFTLSDSVVINRDRVFLRGAGMEATKLILAGGANCHVVSVPTRGAGVTTVYGGVADMRIDGNHGAQGAGNWCGVYAYATRYFRVTRCHICEMKGNGLKWDGDLLDGLNHFGWWNVLEQCRFEYTRGHVYCDGSEANAVIDNFLTDCEDANYTLEFLSGGHLISRNVIGSFNSGHTQSEVRLANGLPSRLVNNRFDTARRSSLVLSAGNQIVEGNEFVSASISGSAAYPTIAASSGKNTIVGNTFSLQDGFPSYHLLEDGGVTTPNLFVGNTVLSPGVTGVVSLQAAAGTVVRNNVGYVTDRAGTGTITAGTSTTVTHGLAAAPTRVLVTPTTSVAQTLAVTTKGSTTFTVTASASTTVTFDWRAQIGDAG